MGGRLLAIKLGHGTLKCWIISCLMISEILSVHPVTDETQWVPHSRLWQSVPVTVKSVSGDTIGLSSFFWTSHWLWILVIQLECVVVLICQLFLTRKVGIFSFSWFQDGHQYFYSVASLRTRAQGQGTSAHTVISVESSELPSPWMPAHLIFVSQLHPHNNLSQSSWTCSSQEIRMDFYPKYLLYFESR